MRFQERRQQSLFKYLIADMIRSKNVTLRSASEEPLRRVEAKYGSADAMAALLEKFVLLMERHVKRGCPSSQAVAVALKAEDLVGLLSDISVYGSLGAMGGADAAVCHSLQPLLTRLMKSMLLSDLFDSTIDEEGEAAGERFPIEAALAKTSEALSNCGGGVARRMADSALDVVLTAAQGVASPDGPRSGLDASEVLSVRFGYADYTDGETGAMLWAGAVALSLFLIENYRRWIHLPRAIGRAADEAISTGAASSALRPADFSGEHHSSPGRGQRILELGCGPALLSLTIALYGSRLAYPHCNSQQLVAGDASSPSASMQQCLFDYPCELDISDVAPSVVDEARRSVVNRNGSRLGAMLNRTEVERARAPPTSCGASSAEADTLVLNAASTIPFRIRCFCLDFCNIPPDLFGRYDLIVASDIVYDYDIAARVAPALELLLCSGGVALLCCEAHRDGMQHFAEHIQNRQSASHLDILEKVSDITEVLTQLEMPHGLTASSCQLLVIRRR